MPELARVSPTSRMMRVQGLMTPAPTETLPDPDDRTIVMATRRKLRVPRIEDAPAEGGYSCDEVTSIR